MFVLSENINVRRNRRHPNHNPIGDMLKNMFMVTTPFINVTRVLIIFFFSKWGYCIIV